MPHDALLGQLPTCPALRPGVAVVRRDAGQLQIGLDAPLRVVLPDAPEVHGVLGALRAETRPRLPSPLARRALIALLEADLLVDATLLRSAAGAAAAATHGSSAAERLVRRAAAVVDVRTDTDSLATISATLVALGCAAPVTAADSPDVVVVATPGPLAREDLDPLVRDEVPLLVLSAVPEGVTLGPFVVPGVTACVRCVDAHLAEGDPRRAVAWEQAARAPRGRFTPDPALWAMALAWAARDVVALLDGDEPTTWSATAHLTHAAAPVVRTWLRHPHCGCTWADDLAGEDLAG